MQRGFLEGKPKTNPERQAERRASAKARAKARAEGQMEPLFFSAAPDPDDTVVVRTRTYNASVI